MMEAAVMIILAIFFAGLTIYFVFVEKDPETGRRPSWLAKVPGMPMFDRIVGYVFGGLFAAGILFAVVMFLYLGGN